MIYVDALKHYPDKPFGHAWWAHLYADDDAELRAFATKLGLRPEWFQNKEPLPHYDVTRTYHAAALGCGARLVSWRELAAHVRLRRAALRVGTETTNEEIEGFMKAAGALVRRAQGDTRKRSW